MTITELVQDRLKHNNQIAVFAARRSGKTYSARELRMRLSEDALIMDDADIMLYNAKQGRDSECLYLLDCALGDGADIVLLGSISSSYNPNRFDDTWTKLTVTPQL